VRLAVPPDDQFGNDGHRDSLVTPDGPQGVPEMPVACLAQEAGGEDVVDLGEVHQPFPCQGSGSLVAPVGGGVVSIDGAGDLPGGERAVWGRGVVQAERGDDHVAARVRQRQLVEIGRRRGQQQTASAICGVPQMGLPLTLSEVLISSGIPVRSAKRWSTSARNGFWPVVRVCTRAVPLAWTTAGITPRQLAERAEQAAEAVEIPSGMAFRALRRRVRAALEADGVGRTINELTETLLSYAIDGR
jgi:hypothetical protein